MVKRAAVSDLSLEKVRRWCAAQVPPNLHDKMRVEVDVRGGSLTILECRPPWDPDLGPEWIRTKIAQLRYRPDEGHWLLFWADRNSRWHRYSHLDPASDVDELLREIDEDPTCIFWG